MKPVLALATALCLTGPKAAALQEPADGYAVVRALAAEMAGAPDSNVYLARNRSKITPQVAAAADDLANLDLETGNLKEAKSIAGFGAAAFGQLGDAAGETRMLLAALYAALPETQEPQAFANLRTRGLKLGAAAHALARPDLVYMAEVIATLASISQFEATNNQREALPVYLQAMADATTALKQIPQSASRVWVQSLIKRLVSVLNDSTEFPFTILGGKDKRDVLLKQIAGAVEQEIPIDFHFAPTFGSAEQTVDAALVLANLSYAYGSADVASKRLALAAQRAKDMGDPDLWASVATTRSEAEWAAGAPAARVKQLRDEAWRVSTAVRSMYASRTGRIWAAYRADQIYGDVLLHQLSQPEAEPQAMFAAAEALKSRTLLDELSVLRTSIPVSPQALELEQRAIGFKPLPKDMFRDNPGFGSELTLISQLSVLDLPGERTHSREQALEQLESMYRKARAGFQGVAPPATLNEVKQTLLPREAILEYVIPFSEADPTPGLWMLFVSRDRVLLAKSPLNEVEVEDCKLVGRTVVEGTPLDQSPLGCLITNLRIAIQRSDQNFVRSALKVLHFLLIDPILAKGVKLEDFDRLIVVPQGPLHYIPFAALLDEEGQFLITKVGLSMAPSASVWRQLSLRSGDPRQFGGYANPNLKFATKEMAGIQPPVTAAGWTASIADGKDKKLLLKTIQSAGVLHLATHGGFPEENAQDRHYLVIGSDNSADNVLTASEVRTLDLSANRLAVLSVCNGGLYRVGPGNELYGLIPAFLEAGTQSVVGTLWPLDDAFGRAFMEEFYQHLAADGPAGALRETERHFVAKNELIVNWAAFVVMGSGSFSVAREQGQKLESGR